MFPTDHGDEIVSGVRVAGDASVDAWRGGALFAEHGGEEFEKACITKAEYEEMGNGYLKEHGMSNRFFTECNIVTILVSHPFHLNGMNQRGKQTISTTRASVMSEQCGFIERRT